MIKRKRKKKDNKLESSPHRPASQLIRVQEFFEQLQESICRRLQGLDATGQFVEDLWKHKGGGGGRTRILQDGTLFEKAGVNTSAISGTLSEAAVRRLGVSARKFSAAGISLVLHPDSPMIPAVHANFRYFETSDGEAWFGGGSDLTPCYLFEEDARHFHSIWKRACDLHNPRYYVRFKQSCDDYFFLKHHNETRGIGGIFFDNLKGDFEPLFAFVRECGKTFLDAYLPIVERRRNAPWGEEAKKWQLVRRGRYVEFNLLYDRGTAFGLETQGRVESILMSLPPLVKWEYGFQPKPGSREEELLEVLRKPREWV